jgi:nucleoredoxin
MRFFLANIILLALASLGLAGALPPLTVKDVSLMLRSGYSSDAVQQELRARHFFGPLDANGEKNLTQAGASPALINALKMGALAVPASEVAAAQAELKAKQERRAAQVEESRKQNSLYQAQLAQKGSTPGAKAGPAGAGIATLVKGNLVRSRNGVLAPWPDAEFEKKKLIGLYFSAHWCGPCRKFTPQLVAYYNTVAAAHPEFEIVFVSNDKTAAEMEGYVREAQMPWPVVAFENAVKNGALDKYAGTVIPCLVVVDENGKVIFDTYAGKNYRGPEAVLADLDQLFAGKSPSQLAQVR